MSSADSTAPVVVTVNGQDASGTVTMSAAADGYLMLTFDEPIRAGTAKVTHSVGSVEVSPENFIVNGLNAFIPNMPDTAGNLGIQEGAFVDLSGNAVAARTIAVGDTTALTHSPMGCVATKNTFSYFFTSDVVYTSAVLKRDGVLVSAELATSLSSGILTLAPHADLDQGVEYCMDVTSTNLDANPEHKQCCATRDNSKMMLSPKRSGALQPVGSLGGRQTLDGELVLVFAEEVSGSGAVTLNNAIGANLVRVSGARATIDSGATDVTVVDVSAGTFSNANGYTNANVDDFAATTTGAASVLGVTLLRNKIRVRLSAKSVAKNTATCGSFARCKAGTDCSSGDNQYDLTSFDQDAVSVSGGNVFVNIAGTATHGDAFWFILLDACFTEDIDAVSTYVAMADPNAPIYEPAPYVTHVTYTAGDVVLTFSQPASALTGFIMINNYPVSARDDWDFSGFTATKAYAATFEFGDAQHIPANLVAEDVSVDGAVEATGQSPNTNTYDAHFYEASAEENLYMAPSRVLASVRSEQCAVKCGAGGSEGCGAFAAHASDITTSTPHFCMSVTAAINACDLMFTCSGVVANMDADIVFFTEYNLWSTSPAIYQDFITYSKHGGKACQEDADFSNEIGRLYVTDNVEVDVDYVYSADVNVALQVPKLSAGSDLINAALSNDVDLSIWAGLSRDLPVTLVGGNLEIAASALTTACAATICTAAEVTVYDCGTDGACGEVDIRSDVGGDSVDGNGKVTITGIDSTKKYKIVVGSMVSSWVKPAATTTRGGPSKNRVQVIPCTGTCGLSSAAQQVTVNGMVPNWSQFTPANTYCDPAGPIDCDATSTGASNSDFSAQTGEMVQGAAIRPAGWDSHLCYKKCAENAQGHQSGCPGYDATADVASTHMYCIDFEQAKFIASNDASVAGFNIAAHTTRLNFFGYANDVFVGTLSDETGMYGYTAYMKHTSRRLTTDVFVPSTTDLLRYENVTFTQSGRFKLCYCDEELLTFLSNGNPSFSVCNSDSDFKIEVGEIHVSGISCLLEQGYRNRVCEEIAGANGGLMCSAP